jgi:hypothetical protein
MAPLIVGNCSGFYGDRLAAAKEMVTGGPIDVLTGDYLAEVTMAILLRQRMADPKAGYVGTFLKQMEEVLGTCLERGIRVVANAGGLNPKGLAEALEALAARLGLRPKIAWIEGDDLMPRLEELQAQGEAFLHLDRGVSFREAKVNPVTANAYLGGWGIQAALERGADIVVCPRVTDAALTIGPAAWKFGWRRDQWDQLAGALAAGHILECGAQATGGNYSFFQEVPSFDRIGYPLAEIHADGSFVVTKHPGTGGLVSVGTVTAQLLYEIGPPAYLNPDVTAHFDTLHLAQEGPDRVRVGGCKGSPPPATAKVCINTLRGHRNSMGIRLAGLDIEAKARVVEQTLFNALGGKDRFDEVDVQLLRTDKEQPASNDEALATLRVTVVSQDAKLAGRLFSAKVVELALANIPGFTLTAPPGDGAPNIVYWPALVGKAHLRERVHVGGEVVDVPQVIVPPAPTPPAAHPAAAPPAATLPTVPSGETVPLHLGRLAGTRSGDKGGNANLGLWCKTPAAYAYLRAYLTAERLKALLPDLAACPIQRYELPNLLALNFQIEGLLGEGGTSSTRTDPQAKTLGEYLRAQRIPVPKALAQEAAP